MNLDADLYELSQIITYDSLSDMVRTREEAMRGPIDGVKAKKLELAQKKFSYKGKKAIPPEDQEIVLNIRRRIDRCLWKNTELQK